MNEKLYSVEEIAKILDLHIKTVRRFINEGKIKGIRVGREWRVQESHTKNYLSSTGLSSSQSIIERNSSATTNDVIPSIQVSAVVEIHYKDYEAVNRLSNSLIAVMNCKDSSYGKTSYQVIEEKRLNKVRLLLWGSPAFVGDMLLLINNLDLKVV